ncbi:MAG: hypothetical protein U0Q16_16910 [Bryobacteraceae bacterium]
MSSSETVDSLLAGADPGAAFEQLAEHYRREGEFSRLFEARMMRSRHALGLPLLGNLPEGVPEATRRNYDASLAEAAREAGSAFLASGDIGRAWPYYRALGDPAPVVAAIENFQGGEQLDAAIEIALSERLHPRKGIELILEHHGICRAITCFDQYPDPASRDRTLLVLIGHLHSELAANLRGVIAAREGTAPPESASIAELVAGRDWLFGEYDYYIDTSHLTSLLRYALDSEDREVLSKAVDLTAYGAKLGPMFQYKSDPPLDRMYEDHRVWLRALLGEDVDAAVAHFKRKAGEADPDQFGSYPSQVVVKFLVRLSRVHDAIEVFERHLKDTDPRYLSCPQLDELLRLAGEYDRLAQHSLHRGDLLGYAAARIERARQS